MLSEITPTETTASPARPTRIKATASTKMTMLMKVKTFSRTICAYVRPVAGGMLLPNPCARRSLTSGVDKPAIVTAAGVAEESVIHPRPGEFNSWRRLYHRAELCG